MRTRILGQIDAEALREALSFGLVGVVNTVLCLAVIWLAGRAGAGPYLANILGYAVGLTNSFLMNRRFTFRKAAGLPGAPLRFLIAFAAAYLVNIATLTVFLMFDPTRPFLWQIPAMVAYTGVFFILSKLFVFPRPAS